ncbi:MAG: nucleotidyltransferase family protein [Terracidiphilus sp.]
MSRLFGFESEAASRARRLKDAVLACFDAPAQEAEERFAEFGLRDWQRILYWIDISGMALYLLDRLKELGIERCLPEEMRARFEQNLVENRERTEALFQEAAALSDALRRQEISFALLKGITLTPESVRDPALRWQIDLDYLVAARDATAARHVVMDFGYTLHAVCGNTMEFWAGESSAPDMRNIYRVRSQRSLELHMLSTTAGRDGKRQDRLARIAARDFGGAKIPTLSPADILVQQALHLFKHLCGEHTRASWVLELRRHVEARSNDGSFWESVEQIARHEPQGEVALGAALLLSKLMFPLAAVPAFGATAISKLPSKVRMWVESFGARVLLADSSGNKLYLILRKELRGGREQRKAIRKLVFPAHLPPPITRGVEGEGLGARLARYKTEAYYVLMRLWFHIIEGLKYAIELSRWQRRMTEISR